MNFQNFMRFGRVANHSGTRIRQTRKAEPVTGTTFRNFVLLIFLIFVTGCSQKQSKSVSHLTRVKHAGELRVVTRIGPTSYFEGTNGPAGLEHDLVQLFAERLNVRVHYILAGTTREVMRTLAEGKADLAAAGLMVSPEWSQEVRYGPPYRRITEQVLYGESIPQPYTVSDLSPGRLEVVAGGGHLGTLKTLKRKYPRLRWRVRFDHGLSDLFYLASEGMADYVVADSDQTLLLRRFYPGLRVAFDIGKPRDLAWATHHTEDPSLQGEVAGFFEDIRRNQSLAQLIDRYYGHAEKSDPALDSSLREDFQTRLPRFRRMFEQAGARHGLDWRLLAAIAYQESKWKHRAVSPEGVRGMMMLTAPTARELKVRDRFDPAQSIEGGAYYLRQTLAGISSDIGDPDRLWYALAAYNLGPGHVEDARHLVRQHGGDPDKWIEIKKVLPLLGKPDWYHRTRHGKARGSVAVHYVNSIRRYYDLLVWLTEEEASRRLALEETVGKTGGVY